MEKEKVTKAFTVFEKETNVLGIYFDITTERIENAADVKGE